jgi:hypothetical protein
MRGDHRLMRLNGNPQKGGILAQAKVDGLERQH